MPAQLTSAAQLAGEAKTPFPGASAECERARQALLAEEIEFGRHMRLVEQRRALPTGPVITTDYRFKDERWVARPLWRQEHARHLLLDVLAAAPAPCPMCTNYAKDLGVLMSDGSEYPALVVYKRDGDRVRLFWAGEMTKEMADPGQDPREAPDIGTLWTILDLTPEGRGTDWYPKLQY